MIQLQRNEALARKDHKEYTKLAKLEFLLKSFLAEYLSEFELTSFASNKMTEFGMVIYRERPTILSLNYDCIVEAAINTASGLNVNLPMSLFAIDKAGGVKDDELSYSHFNWNRPLAYGFRFDYIELQRPGLSTYVDGNRFYNDPKNKLYSWKILKLHGSLNWFHYLPIRKNPTINTEEQKLSEEKLREVLLVNGHWWLSEPPVLNGWILDPLIITPVLYKDQDYQNQPFLDIWKQAHEELSACKRLVIIGYSFPPTDFSIRKLLLESFCENALKELIIVNPDESIISIVKELTHFDKRIMVCRDLEEYLC